MKECYDDEVRGWCDYRNDKLCKDEFCCCQILLVGLCCESVTTSDGSSKLLASSCNKVVPRRSMGDTKWSNDISNIYVIVNIYVGIWNMYVGIWNMIRNIYVDIWNMCVVIRSMVHRIAAISNGTIRIGGIDMKLT